MKQSVEFYLEINHGIKLNYLLPVSPVDPPENIIQNQPPGVLHKKPVFEYFAIITGKHMC